MPQILNQTLNQKLNQKFIASTDRWKTITQNNPEVDDSFFYAVKTTGIYCRLTCSSRLPRPENILFFPTYADAEASGFRACKRCQPNNTSPRDRQIKVIADICKLIEAAETPISLSELASIASLSQYHFQRVFKEIVGVSPKKYANAQRAQRVRDQLQQEGSITETIYDAGFGSSSRFYTETTRMLGMTPAEYKKGAKGREIHYAIGESFLGWVIVAATEKGICSIEFGESPEALVQQIHHQFPQAKFCEEDLTFNQWVTQIIAFIEMPQSGLNLPLDIQGTVFQQKVWQALQAIPAGSTLSYAELAKKIGNPKAVRAVARACASNQVAVAVPCHRVVGSNGKLTGYRWGIDRKQALLERESNHKVLGIQKKN